MDIFFQGITNHNNTAFRHLECREDKLKILRCRLVKPDSSGAKNSVNIPVALEAAALLAALTHPNHLVPLSSWG